MVHPVHSRRHWRVGRRAALAALGLATAAWAVQAGLSSAQPKQGTGGKDTLLTGLERALAEVMSLHAQVSETGKVLPKFGDRAQDIINKAVAHAGTSAEEVTEAVDGALQCLFLRQVALLRRQVAGSLDLARPAVDALAQAEKRFEAEAQALIRPGSAWSIEADRKALHAQLTGTLRRGAALVEERARAARLQQATMNVIGKLLVQMEQLQQKVQGAATGGASPWVLSTSYRIPNTPLQLVGRYEQGRANVELNLTPEKDPSCGEASFIEGIGPANFGVSFNLGV